jgi:aminoglycoside 6'-N-acetyltransferase I
MSGTAKSRSCESEAIADRVGEVCIRVARSDDCGQVARMCQALWPEASVADHARELSAVLEGRARSTLPVTLFVAQIAAGVAGAADAVGGRDAALIGFVEAGLRSHADGCARSRAVGFIEGWYVEKAWRGRGVGGKLLAAAEDWARIQGCAEMASDTWIDNEGSQRAHEALGYKEVDRCVHYRKRL